MAAAAHTISLAGITGLAGLDLRNGAIATIAEPSRASAIPDKYYWRNVELGADTVPYDAFVLYLSTVYADLSIAEPSVENVPAPVAPALTDLAGWEPAIQAANAISANRQRAIVLGSIRAAATGAWRIATVEISRTELRADTIWSVRRPAAAPAASGSAPAPAPARPPIAASLTSGHSDATADLTKLEALALSFGNLTDEEADAAFRLTKLGFATVPMAGLSLLGTNHHYLSANSSKVAGIERQVLGGLTGAFRDWMAGSLDEFRDLAWHKSVHPVSTVVLKTIAAGDDTAARLASVGLGAAAIRLPFKEDAVKRGEAYLAIRNAITTSLAQAAYTVRMENLAAALAFVETFPVIGVAPAPKPSPFSSATQIASREVAIRVVLEPRLVAAAPIAAWCAGYYFAQQERAGTSVGRDTLLNAYSIKKVRRDMSGDFAQGTEAHKAYVTFVRAAADGGQLPAIALSD